MKIAVCSDLHLEFGDLILNNTDDADVLVLAGDILIADALDRDLPDFEKLDVEELSKLSTNEIRALRYLRFVDRVSKQFPQVVVIAGNHEFYKGKWVKSLEILRNAYGKFPNVHFLENNHVTFSDVTFVGGTLWTDMNNGDPLTLYSVKGVMNDFRVIHNDARGYTKLHPSHTVARHRATLNYIEEVVNSDPDKKYVVVGHHAPTMQSIHPDYISDTVVNGAYASNLSEFILDHPQIKLWVHGHIHYVFDYMVGETRVVCRPRGYAGSSSDFELVRNFKPMIVEV